MGQNTNKVSIANAALLKLGDELIISLEDGSKRAESIKTIFDAQYEILLRKHNWNFATKRILIPADAEKPAFDWQFAYTLPPDFVRLVYVRDGRSPVGSVTYMSGNEVLFEFEGRKVLTNLPSPLKIAYIYTAPITLMEAAFENCLATQIAYELAEAVSRSNPKKQQLAQEYEQLLKLAKRVDTLEGPARPMPDTGWVYANLVR